MEYDIVGDLAYGDGAEHMLENHHVSVSEIEDPVLKFAVIRAYAALDAWKDAGRRVQTEAERVMKERD